MREKPFVFIGSSAEGLEAAKGIQANLDYTCEYQIGHKDYLDYQEEHLKHS
jgi:hypothetical protein